MTRVELPAFEPEWVADAHQRLLMLSVLDGFDGEIVDSGLVLTDGGRTLAGFRGSTGDCVTRAISIATGRPYRRVYDDLNAVADSVPRRGASRRREAAVKSKPTSRTGHHRRVYEEYLRRLGGWSWTPTMAVGSGCTVHLRPDELPDGRLIVRLSRHLVAVVDGVVYDAYDSRRDGTRCVYGYWRFER